MEDLGGTDSVRRYQRVERVEDFSVTEFDGEGLISKEYAARLNKALGGRHTSFQIRLPFVKGMLHQVDFHDFFRSAGTTHLTDLWGVNHPVAKVDIILTKSMFKGYGWLTASGMNWDDYWDAFRRYHHALYITNSSAKRTGADHRAELSVPEPTVSIHWRRVSPQPIWPDSLGPQPGRMD